MMNDDDLCFDTVRKLRVRGGHVNFELCNRISSRNRKRPQTILIYSHGAQIVFKAKKEVDNLASMSLK